MVEIFIDPTDTSNVGIAAILAGVVFFGAGCGIGSFTQVLSDTVDFLRGIGGVYYRVLIWIPEILALGCIIFLALDPNRRPYLPANVAILMSTAIGMTLGMYLLGPEKSNAAWPPRKRRPSGPKEPSSGQNPGENEHPLGDFH